MRTCAGLPAFINIAWFSKALTGSQLNAEMLAVFPETLQRQPQTVNRRPVDMNWNMCLSAVNVKARRPPEEGGGASLGEDGACRGDHGRAAGRGAHHVGLDHVQRRRCCRRKRARRSAHRKVLLQRHIAT